MKKIATKLLYVFSFSLLFVALYLNFFSKEKAEVSFLRTEKKTELSNAGSPTSNAVAQPENHTVLK
jgi:hypothetical protein